MIALCCDYYESSVEEIILNYRIDLSDCEDGICTASAYGLEKVEAAKRETVREYLMDQGAYCGETATGFVYSAF